MATDPDSQITATNQPAQSASEAQELPSLAGEGNSLAQSARLKQLKTARIIMFVLGVLFIVVNLFEYKIALQMIDDRIKQDVSDAARQGMIIDQEEIAAYRAAAYRIVQLMLGGLIGIGVMYIIFGFIINKYPVPITIVALVVYVGYVIVLGVLDWKTLPQGLIIKLIIVVALGKAVQAAIAYKAAENEAAFADTGLNTPGFGG